MGGRGCEHLLNGGFPAMQQCFNYLGGDVGEITAISVIN